MTLGQTDDVRTTQCVEILSMQPMKPGPVFKALLVLVQYARTPCWFFRLEAWRVFKHGLFKDWW